MTEQSSRFATYAGQLVASGISSGAPLAALEASMDKTAWANLNAIHGMLPVIKDIFIHETRVFQNPLSPYITRYDERYGAGLEQVTFKYGQYNEKQDGACFTAPDLTTEAQLDVVNFAYSNDVKVFDYEIDKAVLDDGQRGAYVANKLLTAEKNTQSMKYRAWVQLLSDVVDGTRSISSTIMGNGINGGSATSVTYNPTIKGYAGKVDKIDTVLPDVAVGSKYTINTPIEAIDILNQLKSVAADFKFESTAYNKLGVDTFTTGVPLLIAETKVLDACDAVFAEFNAKGNANGYYGYAGFPTKSFRDAVREFAELVEIDSFAALPTDPLNPEVSYTGYGLKFVLIDRDAFYEVWKNATVESQRCGKQRMTLFNWQGQAILSIWRGVDSYAIVAKKAGDLTASFSHATVAAGTESVTSGTALAVAPGTTISITPADGYSVTGVTINGTSIGAVTEFAMPQEDAVVVITTAS